MAKENKRDLTPSIMLDNIIFRGSEEPKRSSSQNDFICKTATLGAGATLSAKPHKGKAI